MHAACKLQGQREAGTLARLAAAGGSVVRRSISAFRGYSPTRDRVWQMYVISRLTAEWREYGP